ncbi:ABC transporter ATP-binding protein/permease [Jatrophihabitans telluris]|uniref:ABC transporter ATP-binding protein/permease n=1 Tax=Jatrophihabitans telluris TaxID=2038343 RepID=A0ABY4QZT3_9ACTN|nr:ABC transporter ATP-binding protein [Jatrophihabitans telluris]UQX89133.1 ABC transporter ATP-binding protein/permease [Jatrophihabitans telluris]
MSTEADWRGQLDDDPAKDDEVLTADEGESPLRPKLDREARVLLAELIKPYRRQIAGVFALVVGQVIATMVAPWLIGLAIDHGMPEAIAGHYRTLTQIVGALVVAAAVSGVLQWAFLRRSGTIGQAILFDLRRRVFDHAQRLSVSWHESFTSGRVISRLTSDVDTLRELLDASLDGLLLAVLNITVISVLMLVLDPWLALIALAAVIPLFFLFRWFSARSTVAFRRTRESIALLIVQFVETFNGIRAVQAFRREKRNDAIFDSLNLDYQDANAQVFRLHMVFIPGVTLIGNVATVVVLFAGGMRVANGGLALGVLTAFLLYLRQFYGPMEDVAIFFNSLQSATAALEKLARVLAEKPSVPEPEHPAVLALPVRGEIAFDGVEFSYEPRAERPRVILPELDLNILPGQTVALVGATGAGKTTIAKLISRFYDPTKGAVRLDGISLTDLSEDDLRSSVVMITQDGFLFSGSVADNIAFGRPGASRDEIEAAAREVGADEFIRRLPAGYDTDVRKRGGRLSAGQRQLVAFARAFLADPAVLILDEATSSLDIPTERAVQRALRTVLHGRTALIIAHRLSTVEIADRVLVLDEGRVVEDGTPEVLAGDVSAEGGRFAALHTAWRDSLV